MKATIRWDGAIEFTGIGWSGQEVKMDSAKEKGALPTELLLFGLGGCTAMDVVSILKKMQVPFTALRIEEEAEVTPDHPMRINKVNLNFIVEGENLPADKIEKAIFLSQSKYCKVGNTLRAGVEVDVSFEVNGEKHSVSID